MNDTAVGRTGRDVWRSVRMPVLVITGIVVVCLALLIAAGATTSGPFSPDSTERNGAKALAQLLDDHGVDVTGSYDLSSATGGGQTLLIAPGGSLDRVTWERIDAARWAHIVLIQPPQRALDVLAPGIKSAGTLAERSRPPGCDIGPASKAGNATVAGTSYSVPTSADGCYGDGVHSGVVRIEQPDRIVDVIGTPRAFTNDRLDEDGNAALALNLIGTHAELVWYLPQFESAGGNEDAEDGEPIVPGWVRYLAWMAAIAVLVIAFWRGRRLGPVVPEPLPVVVHAAETTEGRARLYRRSRARDRAAAALRESALGKLQRLHGIGRRTEPVAVVSTVASRTGRDPVAVQYLLYGPPPLDDPALMNLSSELDRLTQEVRRP